MCPSVIRAGRQVEETAGCSQPPGTSMTARVRGLERPRRTGSAGSAADADSRSVLGEQASGVTTVGRARSEHAGGMTDRDDFLAWVKTALYEAELALHNGDAAPRRALWSRNEPVSVLGAWPRRPRAAGTGPALHRPRGELLQLHVVRVRTAGVRRGGRHGLYRRPRAHLGLRRRSAAQLHLAGHAGVPPRGWRVEGSPSPRRHRDRVTLPDQRHERKLRPR